MIITGKVRADGVFADARLYRRCVTKPRDPLGRFSSHPRPSALEQMQRVRAQVERLRGSGARV